MRRASSPRSVPWRQESRSPNGSKVFRDERLNASASVYHYLEYPHALSIFSEGRLRLANPTGWSDPYEQWWRKTLVDRPGAPHLTSAYVLCWSRSRFDDPAWRMAGFQRTNPIIRIRCRVRDILTAASSLAEQRPGSFFTGKVCYEKEEELQHRAKSVQAGEMKEVTRAAANLLLRKRDAFRFEKEVRALWFDHAPQNTALYLPIDAKSVVKQVMCSPHAHPDQRMKIHQEFKERFGVKVSYPGVLHLPEHDEA
jgi:hypothetical protein